MSVSRTIAAGCMHLTSSMVMRVATFRCTRMRRASGFRSWNFPSAPIGIITITTARGIRVGTSGSIASLHTTAGLRDLHPVLARRLEPRSSSPRTVADRMDHSGSAAPSRAARHRGKGLLRVTIVRAPPNALSRRAPMSAVSHRDLRVAPSLWSAIAARPHRQRNTPRHLHARPNVYNQLVRQNRPGLTNIAAAVQEPHNTRNIHNLARKPNITTNGVPSRGARAVTCGLTRTDLTAKAPTRKSSFAVAQGVGPALGGMAGVDQRQGRRGCCSGKIAVAPGATWTCQAANA